MKITCPNSAISISFFFGFCFFYFNNAPLFNDYDTAWHIAAGDLIRDLGYVPVTDSWSFTSGETIWYNVSWLWDVLLSYFNQYFGLSALYYFNAILYGVVIAVVAFNLTLRKMPLASIAISVLLTAVVLWQYSCLRPYTFTFIAVSLYQAYLYLYVKSKNPKYLIILPFLMILWINIHGGFLAGFILIGAYSFVALLDKAWVEASWLTLIGAICVLSLLINPYGFEIYKAITSTTASGFTSYINEWRSFSFGSYWSLSFYTLFFIIFSNSRERSICLEDKILAFIWLFGGLLYIRNFPIFAICSAPYLAGNIVKSLNLRKFSDINTTKLSLISVGIITFLTVSVAIFPITAFVGKDILNDKDRLPSTAVNFIKTNYPNVRFLNDYGLGAYIIYLSRGELPVFVDGRAGTAYKEEVLQDYLNLTSSFPGEFDEILDKYNIKGVITYKDKALNIILSNKNGWRQGYIDPNFVIYLKK